MFMIRHPIKDLMSIFVSAQAGVIGLFRQAGKCYFYLFSSFSTGRIPDCHKYYAANLKSSFITSIANTEIAS